VTFLFTPLREASVARPKVPRTKRGERTRSHILEVTRKLFAQPGFRGVTLDQIAEETGTAKSSILWHFGSKEHLLVEVLDGVIRELETNYRQRYPADLPLAKKMQLFIKDYVRMMEQYPELGAVFFGMLFDAEFINTIRDRVKEMYRDYREMIAQHLRDAGIPATEHLAAAVTALADGVFIQWYLDPRGVDMQKVFESVVRGLEFLESGDSTQRAGAAKGHGKTRKAGESTRETGPKRGR
jgi:AcrR family transcriptional regulator